MSTRNDMFRAICDNCKGTTMVPLQYKGRKIACAHCRTCFEAIPENERIFTFTCSWCLTPTLYAQVGNAKKKAICHRCGRPIVIGASSVSTPVGQESRSRNPLFGEPLDYSDTKVQGAIAASVMILSTIGAFAGLAHVSTASGTDDISILMIVLGLISSTIGFFAFCFLCMLSGENMTSSQRRSIQALLEFQQRERAIQKLNEIEDSLKDE